MTGPAVCRCGHEQREHFHAHRADVLDHDLGPIVHGVHWWAECRTYPCMCARYEPWTPEQVKAMLR